MGTEELTVGGVGLGIEILIVVEWVWSGVGVGLLDAAVANSSGVATLITVVSPSSSSYCSISIAT